MKQKLAIARALIHDPEILFMDEPTANLDPESAKTVREFILDLKKQKKTIFLNTHNLDEAQRICDRIGILNTRLMAVGTPEELERSIHGRKTVIQLTQVNDSILDSLRKVASQELGQGRQQADSRRRKSRRREPRYGERNCCGGGTHRNNNGDQQLLGGRLPETCEGEHAMIAWMPWKIARKELKVIGRKRSIIFYTVGLPLLVAVSFLLVLKGQLANGIPDTYRWVANQLSTSSLF